MTSSWRLDDGRQTLVLASQNNALPCVVYWGVALPLDENISDMAARSVVDVTGGMVDETAPLSVLPAVRDTFHGAAGLEMRKGGAPIYPHFKLANVQENFATGARQSLQFDCSDDALGLGLCVTFIVADLAGDGQIITAQNTLHARGDIDVIWLSAPALPAPQYSDDILDFSGRWIGEFELQSTPWRMGQHVREARLGRSGHEHPPFALFPECGTTNTAGGAYAMHFAWSGGHKMLAEQLPDGRRQVQWGKLQGTMHPADNADGGHIFASSPLHICYAPNGLNGCATTFQRFLRDGVCGSRTKQRKVHYNSWEAIYFNHNLQDLCAIADMAADLGAERFVLDDGWFGRRDDDTTSLGDWQIDRRKWPDGLTPLINHVQSLGMDFGLWFEPEMISKDSDLYRAHPDWVLGPADQMLGRQQLVLDMRRADVRDYVYESVNAILTEYDIAYVKWDHNRLPPITDSRQTDGIYEVFGRLNRAHPAVEIESCASGGGRIDAAILNYTGRVWLSDSNDALERLRIQHNAALFLPSAITGSHVGPRDCHTSGRVMPMPLRAWVAAQRHWGFEMDPREMTDDERDTLKDVTSWYKANRDWLMGADILRLDHNDAAVTGELQLAVDGARFVVFAGKSESSVQIAPRPLRLTGLDADVQYEITLRNRDEAHHLSRGENALKAGPIRASGAWLMGHGVVLPWAFPQTIWVLEGQKLDKKER